jgi:uncharacterized protein (DUF305 family)
MHTNQYVRLLMMTVLSFISMYVFMYAMVDKFDNVYSSYDQAYMAGLMTAPMVIIEMMVMWPMYENKTANFMIVGASILMLGASFVLIRQQTAIADSQFLRSMIPHHAGAILMCENAAIGDDKVKELCKNIIAGQQSEINMMKAKLSELDK